MNTSRKNKSKSKSLPLISVIFFRTILFVFLSQIVLVVFYFVGNFQNFLDSTQRLILNLCSIFSIFQIFFSISGIIYNVVMMIFEKGHGHLVSFIVTVIVYFFFILISILLLLISGTIDIISLGI